MSYPYARINVESPGNILTASNYNAEHDNHITNNIPASVDDYSANATQSNAQSDPGEYGNETLAISTAEELEQLRFVLARIIGGLNDSWRDVPSISLSSLVDNEIGSIKNLKIAYSGGTLTISSPTGNLSATNMGYVNVPSTTAGLTTTLAVTANATLNDDAASPSHMTNLEWGITAGANWSNDMPFFLYVANKDNTDLDGADGSSVFFIARNPCLTSTPSSANDIGDQGNIPVNDSQNVILILDDVTVANYTSLPCQLIGTVRMQYLTSSHDWTIQNLGNTDGLGQEQLDKQFQQLWVMPAGQNGASSGKYFLPNSGTAPVFTDNYHVYTINRLGYCKGTCDHNGDGGTDGSGSVNLQYALPYTTATAQTTLMPIGMSYIVYPGITSSFALLRMDTATAYTYAYKDSGAAVEYTSFSNGARNFEAHYEYKAF